MVGNWTLVWTLKKLNSQGAKGKQEQRRLNSPIQINILISPKMNERHKYKV
jgi:hypothetical protein